MIPFMLYILCPRVRPVRYLLVMFPWLGHFMQLWRPVRLLIFLLQTTVHLMTPAELAIIRHVVDVHVLYGTSYTLEREHDQEYGQQASTAAPWMRDRGQGATSLRLKPFVSVRVLLVSECAFSSLAIRSTLGISKNSPSRHLSFRHIDQTEPIQRPARLRIGNRRRPHPFLKLLSSANKLSLSPSVHWCSKRCVLSSQVSHAVKLLMMVMQLQIAIVLARTMMHASNSVDPTVAEKAWQLPSEPVASDPLVVRSCVALPSCMSCCFLRLCAILAPVQDKATAAQSAPSPKEPDVNAPPMKKSSSARACFARIGIKRHSSSSADGCTQSQSTPTKPRHSGPQVVYKFHEGTTNAIRRTLRIADLL